MLRTWFGGGLDVFCGGLVVVAAYFKSDPAEEIIECRRHDKGRARGGLPLSLGVLPRENFDFLALLCAFLMGFMRLGPDSSHKFLLEQIFLGA